MMQNGDLAEADKLNPITIDAGLTTKNQLVFGSD
jgi:tRNA-binding EMAP/Myf-like protein